MIGRSVATSRAPGLQARSSRRPRPRRRACDPRSRRTRPGATTRASATRLAEPRAIPLAEVREPPHILDPCTSETWIGSPSANAPPPRRPTSVDRAWAPKPRRRPALHRTRAPARSPTPARRARSSRAVDWIDDPATGRGLPGRPHFLTEHRVVGVDHRKSVSDRDLDGPIRLAHGCQIGLGLDVEVVRTEPIGRDRIGRVGEKPGERDRRSSRRVAASRHTPECSG